MCHKFLFSLVGSNLLKQIHVIKTLITALTKEKKKTSRELLNFRNFIYKEKCRYSQNERV